MRMHWIIALKQKEETEKKKEIFRLFGRSLERVRMSDDYAS